MSCTSTTHSSTNIAVRRNIKRAELFLLEAAERQGFSICRTWDGTTPYWILNDKPIGWTETFLCLLASCEVAYSVSGQDLIQDLIPRIEAIASALPIVVAHRKCVHDKELSIPTSDLESLFRKIKRIKRLVTTIAAAICLAMDDAKMDTHQKSIAHNDPVFLTQVYNRCFLDRGMKKLIEDAGPVLYSFSILFSNWLSERHIENLREQN